MGKVQKFIDKAIEIAKDNKHGYSQLKRWGPDYDCSSLVYECAYHAGYEGLSQVDPRYTGSIVADFTAIGFRCDFYDGNLYDLEPGDILLNTAYHVAIYIGNGDLVEASSDEEGGIEGKNPGDQTGNEIHIAPVYNYPWTHVLTPPYENDSNVDISYKTVSNTVSSISIDDAIKRIAIEAINGKYGNGDKRKDNIYSAVQDAVNKLLKG